MITFRQLQTGPVGRASGLDVNSDDFMQYCNDAVEQLMTRGNWWATVMEMTGCVRDNCIVWPRGVATILALNECRRNTIVVNHWYQFRPCDFSHKHDFDHYARNGWAGTLHTMAGNTSPVFNPVKSDGFTIRFFISLPSDAGKTVTVYGVDNNGQNIRTQRSDGTVQDGVQVILANPSADTPMAIRHVSRIVKDETDAAINAYQFNVAQGFLLDLAQWQATEVNPEYITSQITGHRGRQGGCCIQQVSALVKLRFVPFKYADDLVQIDNQSAIRDMLLAIRKKEQGDIAGSVAYELRAIRELNYQMKNLFPDEQFICNFLPFGRNDSLNNSNIRIGML